MKPDVVKVAEIRSIISEILGDIKDTSDETIIRNIVFANDMGNTEYWLEFVAPLIIKWDPSRTERINEILRG